MVIIFSEGGSGDANADNLSRFMRQLGMNYAIYFNKKYQRTGHLWQGRFHSWYVTDEAYLYTLMLYIEHNPLKANIVHKLEAYSYSSYHYFLDADTVPECLTDAWIVQAYRQGYSQHKIAGVLGLNQATVQRIIKRTEIG